jgi:hypothetical protein
LPWPTSFQSHSHILPGLMTGIQLTLATGHEDEDSS